MAQHIKVVEYNSEWKDIYQQEENLLIKILGSELVGIYHIGSTAVKGLKAKPIIDIMAVVKKNRNVDKCNPKFEKSGYECMGELGMPGRRYFRKGGDERTHQIHIFEESNQKDIIRHLALRDYLRTHKEVANTYGELKSKLAQLYPESIDDYCDGKEELVTNMEQDALKWNNQYILK